MIDDHLKGHFSTDQAGHRSSCASSASGRIINFTSISGLVGNAGQANYGAAKAGIAGLTRVVARDLGRYGVTCNAIAPARRDAHDRRACQTVRAAARGPAVPVVRRRCAHRRPLARRAPARCRHLRRPPGADDPMRSADMIAPMVCFLASDFAWNINGQIFARPGRHRVADPPPAGLRRRIYKPGMWTLDELDEIVPDMLLRRHHQPGAARRRHRSAPAARRAGQLSPRSGRSN